MPAENGPHKTEVSTSSRASTWIEERRSHGRSTFVGTLARTDSESQNPTQHQRVKVGVKTSHEICRDALKVIEDVVRRTGTARNQAHKTLATGVLRDLEVCPMKAHETGMEAGKPVEDQEQDGAEDAGSGPGEKG